MAEAPGEQIDQYRLVAPIGRGGFATVYRALDERLDSTVAMKILAENHALDGDIRERFVSEAQLLRRVACPEIISVHDVGETSRRQPYMVLTYASGGDLRERVDNARSAGHVVGDFDLLLVADTLAAALRNVHGAGIVHRDVKPDNLLIDSARATEAPGADGGIVVSGERLMLGDLGYAKDLDAGSGLTVGGGTQGFNAPEQRIALNTVDHRADVFGASALLFWLLTGQTPPSSPEQVRVMLGAHRCAPSIASTIEVGLAHAADQRHPDIDVWQRSLREGMTASPVGPLNTVARQTPAVTGLTVAPVAPDAATLTAAPNDRPSRLPSVLAAIGGLALGLLMAAVAWFSLGGDSATVTQLDDGRVSVQREQGDLRLGVFGPPSVQVGEQAVFEAAATGATSISWINADGGVVTGETRLVVNARRVGQGRVTLLATDVDGRTETVELTYDVVE